MTNRQSRQVSRQVRADMRNNSGVPSQTGRAENTGEAGKKTRILHVKLRVQIEDEPPQELIDAYINGNTPGGVSPRGGFMKSPDKAYKRLREVLPDVDAVIEKIIKPGIKGTKGLFKPEAFTTTGKKIKDIPTPTQAELEKQARRWFKKTKHAYRHQGKEHAEVMKAMAGLWAKKMLPSLVITGYQDEIRGVGRVAACCLTGVQSVLPLIRPEEFVKKAPLVDIIRPDYGGTFRMRFNSKILSVGRPIIVNKYQPSYIKDGNEQINRLVNAFASNKFVSFTPGGDSRVDFIREDRQLFLEIVVSVH